MRGALHIASNTFKETIRNKVLYNILFVAGIALVLLVSFGDLSVFSRAQVMTDFGLATMSLTGLLLAIFIGVGMLGSEISNRTAYGVLTKPVSRNAFILGKFVGLVLVLFLNFLLVSVVFFVSVRLMGAQVHGPVVYAVILLMIEMAVVVSASILFSSFTTPMLAAIFTLAFYVAGHLNDLMSIGLAQQESFVWRSVLKILYFVLPNLEHFNIRTRVVYELPVSSDYVALAVGYGLLYTTLLIMGAMAIFARKDL